MTAMEPVQFKNNAPEIVAAIDNGPVGKGIEAILDRIDQIGQACTGAIKGLGKGGINVGSKDLTGGLDCAAPPSMGKSESVPSQGKSQQIEKSVMPERVKEQVQAMGSAGGMKVEHVAEVDLGAIAPTAVSAGKQQSMGMGIG